MFSLRQYNPSSPGSRHRVVGLQTNFKKSQKFLLFLNKKKQCSGRNNSGRITFRHRGGGLNKQRVVSVDRIRLRVMLISLIAGIYKQKWNMCFFGLLRYSNGIYTYILLPDQLSVGDHISVSKFLLPLEKLPIGVLSFFLELNIKYIFFNLCSILQKKSLYARAAGTYCRFIFRNTQRHFIRILLPSKKPKNISSSLSTYVATVGRASNIYAYRFVTGKSGVNRNLGFRPIVRGVAMNAVDHPNGGRTKTNKPEKTPWGKVAKKSK